MQVITRITSIASSNPSPIYQEDKNKLNELCLRSFVDAFSDIKPHVTFLADNCTCIDMITEVCTFDHDIIRSNSDINSTMLKTYELASQMEGNVLFQECDYLYKGNQIGKLLDDAISHFGLVSPYDHPDFYSRYDIHPRETRMSVMNNYHFRKSARNTMTWGATADIVRQNKDILDKYGYLDDLVWKELSERNVHMWTPIPSFATHMVENSLAPSTNWEAIWKYYDSKIKFT